MPTAPGPFFAFRAKRGPPVAPEVSFLEKGLAKVRNALYIVERSTKRHSPTSTNTPSGFPPMSTYTVTNANGDVLLANTMPEAEYMYGCTPTAVGMILPPHLEVMCFE